MYKYNNLKRSFKVKKGHFNVKFLKQDQHLEWTKKFCIDELSF